MHSADVAVLVYALYVPLLLSLYALEIVVIFRSRSLQTTGGFHRIFSVLAAVNMTACVVGSFVFRLNLYPIINRFYGGLTAASGWLTAVNVLAYYLNALSELLGVMQALNRFTALYFPLRHDRIWIWAFPAGVLLCLLLSVLPIRMLLDNVNFFVEVAHSNTGHSWFYLNAVSHVPQTTIWINMLIVSATCNVTTLFLYSACLFRLVMFSLKRNMEMERNFFLVGFLNMIFSLPFMAAMLYFYLIPSTGDIDTQTAVFVVFQLPWLTDLKFLTPAPMLLITNKAIRRNIRAIFSNEQHYKSTRINTVSENLNKTVRSMNELHVQ